MISISYFISGFVPWCWIATGFASIAFPDAFGRQFQHVSTIVAASSCIPVMTWL
jgi:hypothetical protein